MNQDGSTLTLDDVTKRFADSEQALSQVKEHLQGLATAQQQSQASQSALADAAQSVRDFSEKASAVVAELEQAQANARQVLQAGAALLDGTGLNDLKTSVDQLRESLNTRLGELEGRTVAIEEISNRSAKMHERTFSAMPSRWQGRAKEG